jgi:hypothetical protein
MKPMIKPTAITTVREPFRSCQVVATYIHPSCHPSLLRAISRLRYEDLYSRLTLVECGGAMRAASRHSSYWYGHLDNYARRW